MGRKRSGANKRPAEFAERSLARFALARFEALDVEGTDKAEARALRSALEREIISRVSGTGGEKALAGIIAHLNAIGHRFLRIATDAGWVSYFENTNEGARNFHIHVMLPTDDDLLTVMVLYGETLEATVAKRRAGLSPAARARAAIEDQYLARGLALNTSGRPYKSLGADDRLVACLHELEGGVSNGGFRTYLSNTRGERVRDAHAFLLAIGARRAAKVVGEVLALYPRGFGAAFRRNAEDQLDHHRVALDRLASRFYDVPENIPLLAMRYLTSHASARSADTRPPKRRRRPPT